MDFDRYAERIAYRGPRDATEDVLSALHLAHATAIPFEDLDIHLGRGIDLAPESVFRKLVVDRRGGYCFEQNGLFLAALRAIGFDVRPLAARVLFGPAVPRPRTHMLLLVTVGGRRFLADVGFGTHNLLGALPFEVGTPHEIHGERFRIVAAEGGQLDLEVELDRWTTLYRFDLAEQLPIDFEMASWFTSTHPKSMFVTTRIVSRPEIGRRLVLIDDELRIRRGAAVETRAIRTVDEYREVLRDTFGIELPAGARLGPRET